MFKKLVFFSFFLFHAVSFGQIGGKSVYQFLNLVTSPRQAALGGKVITIFDYDVNQALFNPATINPEMDGHLSVPVFRTSMASPVTSRSQQDG